MTQTERRIRLIGLLKAELPEYRGIAVPDGPEDQKRFLRTLMNLRPPIPASEELLNLQDAYLTEERTRRGVTDAESLAPAGPDERLFLWRGDITSLKADAIVNAANSALLGCFQPCHSCIDNIIHTYAGIELRLACSEIMNRQGHEEPPGMAKITPGFNLPCRYVLHTVGPIISGPLRQSDCETLAACYRSCLELAAEKGLRSVAFCCISTGVFHFPQERAAEIAVGTVRRFLETNDRIRRVIFDVFSDRDEEIYRRLLEYKISVGGKRL